MRASWMLIMLLGLMAMAGCRTHHRTVTPSQPLPGWVSQPKLNDSVHLYLIGMSEGQASVQAARLAAMEDTQRQLSKMLLQASGAGDEVLDTNGLLPLPELQLVPGCFHYQMVNGAYAGWVQVCFPLSAKRSWVERLSAQ